MTDPLSIVLYGAGAGAGAIATLIGAKKGLPLMLGFLKQAGEDETDPNARRRRITDCGFQESHMAQLHSIHDAMAQTARSLEEIAKDLTQAVTLLKVIASNHLS